MLHSEPTPPTLVLTLGYPGAGKTFFARQFSEDKGFALVSADRLRFELYENPSFSKSEDDIVLNVMDYMIEQFLNAGISVIVDGLNSTRVRRHQLRDLARKFKANPLVVWVQTDINTAFDRASSRDRRQTDDKYSISVDETTFERMVREVKKPQYEEYVVISGKHLFTNQRNAVDRKLTTMTRANNAPKVSLGGRVDMARRRPRPRM